jgi:hypothetical protein
MNKRVFTVEIASENDSLNALTKEDFDYIMRRGLYEYMGNFFAQNVSVNNVEQTVERLKDQDKMLDLLSEACEVIGGYNRGDKTDYLDNLANEINEFLIGKQ